MSLDPEDFESVPVLLPLFEVSELSRAVAVLSTAASTGRLSECRRNGDERDDAHGKETLQTHVGSHSASWPRAAGKLVDERRRRCILTHVHAHEWPS